MLVASGLEHPVPLDPLLAQFPDLLLSLSPAKWQIFSEKKKNCCSTLISSCIYILLSNLDS
jgi:hypothetical protein